MLNITPYCFSVGRVTSERLRVVLHCAPGLGPKLAADLAKRYDATPYGSSRAQIRSRQGVAAFLREQGAPIEGFLSPSGPDRVAAVERLLVWAGAIE